VARKKQSKSNYTVCIGGSADHSALVVGDGNRVSAVNLNVQAAFEKIDRAVDSVSGFAPQTRQELKAELKAVQAELARGDQADQSGILGHLRNIGRMAPDILDVVLATFANPAAGLGMVASKIARKMADQAKP
jgi:hypothetical protein